MPIFIHKCSTVQLDLIQWVQKLELNSLTKLVRNLCLQGTLPLVGSITQGHLWGKRRESFLLLYRITKGTHQDLFLAPLPRRICVLDCCVRVLLVSVFVFSFCSRF